MSAAAALQMTEPPDSHAALTAPVLDPELLSQCGLTPREVQESVARDVTTILNAPAPEVRIVRGARDGQAYQLVRARTGFIDAGTGTGKTLGYLVPLLRYVAKGHRACVSTFTRALQRQILQGSDLVHARVLAGVSTEISVAIRMGRRNFVDRDRILELHAMRHGETHEWQALVDWVNGWTAQTDPLDTTFQAWQERGDASLPTLPGRPKPLVEADIALDAGADKQRAFWYDAHAQAAREADLVITNHATLLLHRRFDLLGQIDAVVIDEADRLEDAARSLNTYRISSRRLVRIARRKGGKVSEKSAKVAAEIEDLLMRLGESTGYQDTDLENATLAEPDLIASLREAYNIFTIPKASPQERHLVSRVREFLDGHTDPESVFYFSWSPVRLYPVIAADPVDVHNAIGRIGTVFHSVGMPAECAPATAQSGVDLDDEEVPPLSGISAVIYTSATLGFLSSPTPMRQVHIGYGVDADTVVLANSYEPLKFGAMTFVLSDNRVSGPFVRIADPDNKDKVVVAYADSWLAYVRKAISSAPGQRKLVLTPAFADVRALSDLGEMDGVLFHPEGVTSHELLQRLANPEIRAVVTPSWWEGVNLHVDGRLWMSDLLITRLPIPPYGEILQSRLIETMLKRGFKSLSAAGDYLYLQRAERAIKKLRQAVGRGIRSENDAIRIWLLDPRITPEDRLAALWYTRLKRVSERTLQEWVPAYQERHKPAKNPHLAIQHFHRAIPKRFQAAVSRASLFTQDGEVIDV